MPETLAMASNIQKSCDLSLLKEPRLDVLRIQDVRDIRNNRLNKIKPLREFMHKGVLALEVDVMKISKLPTTVVRPTRIRLLVMGETDEHDAKLVTYRHDMSVPSVSSIYCHGLSFWRGCSLRGSQAVRTRWCDGLQVKWRFNASKATTQWDMEDVFEARVAHVRALMSVLKDAEAWDEIDWTSFRRLIDQASDQLQVDKAPSPPPAPEPRQSPNTPRAEFMSHSRPNRIRTPDSTQPARLKSASSLRKELHIIAMFKRGVADASIEKLNAMSVHPSTPRYLLKHISDAIEEKEHESHVDYLASFGFDVDSLLNEDEVVEQA